MQNDSSGPPVDFWGGTPSYRAQAPGSATSAPLLAIHVATRQALGHLNTERGLEFPWFKVENLYRHQRLRRNTQKKGTERKLLQYPFRVSRLSCLQHTNSPNIALRTRATKQTNQGQRHGDSTTKSII